MKMRKIMIVKEHPDNYTEDLDISGINAVINTKIMNFSWSCSLEKQDTPVLALRNCLYLIDMV
jgi:hypothetical protein